MALREGRAVRKTNTQATRAIHPVKPRAGKLDIARLHAQLEKRYPKVHAELAK